MHLRAEKAPPEKASPEVDSPELQVDSPEAGSLEAGAPPVRGRTCVGCGERGEFSDEEGAAFVRVVVAPASSDGSAAREIAIDARNARGALAGRGAHLHLTARCIQLAAEKGLARSFKAALSIDGGRVTKEALTQAIGAAIEQRITSMIGAAARAKKLVHGTEATRAALRNDRAALVIVATDAAAAADLTEVRAAVAQGRAVAWGSKLSLGALFGKGPLFGKGSSSKGFPSKDSPSKDSPSSDSPPEGSEPVWGGDGVAVLAVTDRSLARAIQDAVTTVDSITRIDTVSGLEQGSKQPGSKRNGASSKNKLEKEARGSAAGVKSA